MNIEEEVGKLLKDKGLTISVAESCTGGLVQKLITDIPGSSNYFIGGVVAYSNKLKEKLVKVKKSTLEKYGAVSEEVANELSIGIRKITGSDIGVGITGIAGPTGDTPTKPIGLVYIGIANKDKSFVKKFIFKGDRKKIREQASYNALLLVKNLL